MNSMRSLILKHTLPTRKHLTPELVLRLITPECALWGANAVQVPFPDPFWGFYWPGGQAVARYILDNPQMLRNKSVLDVGCGCGAGAIAAKKVAAKHVVANDIDPYAEIITQLNCELNEINLETNTTNLIGSKCDEFDTILIGDMFYDEEFAEILFKWLYALAARDKQVLIGDPGRHGLAAGRLGQLALLARYSLSRDSCLENHGFSDAAVWTINK